MNYTNIFIVGSTGFIGSNLKKFLEINGFNVFCYDKNLMDFFKIETIWPISEQIKSCSPDLIINCAGEIYDESKMVESNVLLVNDLVEYVKSNPTTKLIHLGSSSEYGKVYRAITEADRVDPQNLYAATKAAGTLICQAQARKYNLDIVTVRPFSVYGPNDRPFKLFHRLWECFTDASKSMELYDGKHDWIYIDDFISGIYKIMISDNRLPGEIINLGSGKQSSNFEILRIFQDVYGFVPSSITMKQEFMKAADSRYWVADTTYAKEKYKFDIKTSLFEGIQRIKIDEI